MSVRVIRLVAFVFLLLAGQAQADAAAARTLVVGSEQDYPPFAIGNTDATADGFSVDLWKAVAAESGISYTIRVRPFHELLEEFKDGKIDVLINLAQSDERRRFAEFTVPHVVVHGAVFVREGESRIGSEADLAGKSIIVLKADLAHDYALAKGWQKQLVLVDTAADGFRLLASGLHDAMLISKLAGKQTLEQLKISNVRALDGKAGFAQKFSFAVHRGDADLLASINEGMALSKSAGVYDALYNRWLGVYDEEPSLRPLLKYLLPMAGLLLGMAGFAVYRRQVERRRVEASLRESEERLSLSQAYGGIGSWEADLLTHRQFWSPAVYQTLGFPRLPQPTWDDFLAAVHPDDRQIVVDATQAHLLHGKKYEVEYRIVATDGQIRRMRSAGRAEFGPDGKPVRMRGIVQDITERKQAEQQLRIAATAFEAQEGMLVCDADNVILRVNRAFTEITGYSAEEAIGQTPRLLRSGRQDADFYRAMWQDVRRTGAWQGEIWNRRKNGEVYPEWLTISAVKGDDGETSHYVATLTDITLRKSAEDEIQHLAFYDPLTHLPNRRLLLDRLERALASSARHKRYGALMLLDIDNFKTLNDTLGHAVGDQLLLEVATRLTASVREGDTVARLSGDEFVVILEDLDAEAMAAAQAENVAVKMRAALNQPYLLDLAFSEDKLGKRSHHSTSSIGITMFRGHTATVDELMQRADTAMYQAKAAGRNTLRFFDPQMQAVVTARATLEADLREAVRQGQFVLYYQVQVDGLGQRTGAEALIRWQHPRRGLIAPAHFIPQAEETGLILPLGHWVLETACAALTAWQDRPELAQLTLAVNVSAHQFHQAGFVEQVLQVLAKSGAEPRKLKLELTESLLLDDVEDVIAKMSALKAHGVGFALDDFGTGYSSLSYLKRLPLDQLKIDQSFIWDVLTDPNDAAIAQTIIALSQTMGLSVIAEGVEREEQRDFLAGLGCHAYQGYLFSRPLPREEFERFMSRL